VSGPLDIETTLRFLRALRKNNDRAWFAANRARYDAIVRPGFTDLVAGLLIAASSFDERFTQIEPERCIFRIHRDVRFSPDKSPYKPRVSAFLSPRGWRGTTPGFYLAIEPGDASLFAAGVYVPEKPVLADLRRRLAAGDAAFDRIMRAKRFAPYLPLDTNPLVRMPAGYPRDHPRGDLIRARRYMVRLALRDRDLQTGDLFARLRTAVRDTAPFVRWLDASADATGEPSGWERFESGDP